MQNPTTSALSYKVDPKDVQYRAYLYTVNPNNPSNTMFINLSDCGITNLSISSDADSPLTSVSISCYNAIVDGGLRLNQVVRGLDKLYVDANYGLGWVEVFRGKVYKSPYTSAVSKIISMEAYDASYTITKSKDVLVVESGESFKRAIDRLLTPYMKYGGYEFLRVQMDSEIASQPLDSAVYRTAVLIDIISDIGKRILTRTSKNNASKRLYLKTMYGTCNDDGSRDFSYEGTLYFGCRTKNYPDPVASFSNTEVMQASYSFDLSNIVTQVGVQILRNDDDGDADPIDYITGIPEEATSIEANTTIDFFVSKAGSDPQDRRRFGVFRDIVSPSQSDDLSEDDGYVQGKDYAELILEENGAPKYEYSTDLPDVPFLRPWDLISVNAGANVGIFMIKTIQHEAGNKTMSVGLVRRDYGIPISELRGQPSASAMARETASQASANDASAMFVWEDEYNELL